MYNNVTNYSLAPGPFRHSYTFYTVSLTTLVIIAILTPVAVVGNALVLAAIWRNPSLRTPSYILLAGLASTDLCTGVVTGPFYVAVMLMLLKNPQFDVYYNRPRSYTVIRAISSFSIKYFFRVSLFMVTLMSVERWLHMSRRSVVTARRACFVVTILFVIAIPLVLFASTTRLVGALVYYAISISGLLLCIIVTSIAYFNIFRIISRHQQQIHANAIAQSFAQQPINFVKYKKSIFSILYILAVFYLGYLSLTIAFVLLVLRSDSPVDDVVTTVLLYSSSSLNPLLYLWRMKDIRDEVKRLIKRIFHKDN